MKILVVEDEVFSRMKLQKIMEDLGECEAVENGEDALKIAMLENPPDLILLDIIMPGMDGYEVLEKLKDDPQTKEIPVIFLSALDEKEDIIRGLEMGAVDYISKPFHKSMVKARVRTHLSLKEKTEQLRQKDLQLIEMDRMAGIGAMAAGIAPEVLRQAQNPFFTTKAVGSGTGIGLSLTERIIKRHGGKINISSKEDEGTTVTITLPGEQSGIGPR